MPVYNEIQTITEIITRVQNVQLEKELVIVDDFSTDGTREYLHTLDAENIRVFFHFLYQWSNFHKIRPGTCNVYNLHSVFLRLSSLKPTSNKRSHATKQFTIATHFRFELNL